MSFSHLTNKTTAINFLSEHLMEGTITIFLGAGVSKDFGVPGWVDLLNDLNKSYLVEHEMGFKVADFVPRVSETSTAQDLQVFADEIQADYGSEAALIEAISKILYPNPSTSSLNKKIFKNELFLAIGAMLTGSKRGHVRNIVTLNYDSMIETYLSIIGYIPRIIYELPSLEGSEDVRIYHPHGFVPNPKNPKWNNSSFIILGLDSVSKRLGTIGDPWFEKVRHILRSSICIFIGMSPRTFNDPAIRPLINTVGEEIKTERPTGFWVLRNKLNKGESEAFLRNNIVPLEITEPDGIPDFLLSICQEAANEMLD